MAERIECTFYLAVDSEGQWSVAEEREDVIERHLDNNGLNGGLTLHRLTVSVPLPGDQACTITLPDDRTEEPVVLED